MCSQPGLRQRVRRERRYQRGHEDGSRPNTEFKEPQWRLTKRRAVDPGAPQPHAVPDDGGECDDDQRDSEIRLDSGRRKLDHDH